MVDLLKLPDNLPVPSDDGACDHLSGAQLPPVSLPCSSGDYLNLASLRGVNVIYCYPMTGVPGTPLPGGWDDIPGARGCTPQAVAFRETAEEFAKRGVRVLGVSTQTTEYQAELVSRLALPFAMLSDASLNLQRDMRLPVFQIGDRKFLKRVTMITRDAKIVHVMYPVFPPNTNANVVLDWIDANQEMLTAPARAPAGETASVTGGLRSFWQAVKQWFAS